MHSTLPASAAADTFTCAYTVRIQGEEGPLNIGFDAVQAYHGHAALAMLAVTYMGLQGALTRLEALHAGQPVARHELSVVSGHPGPGVRDALEFITRAVTRDRYQVDTSLPWARYSHDAARSYSFLLTWRNHQVRAILRADTLPSRFFELLGSRTPEDIEAFRVLRRTLAHTLLAQSPDALFEFEQVAA